MIKEICNEVDVVIEKKNLSKKLVNLISELIKNTKDYESKEFDMLLSLDNEIDMFIAGRITHDPKFDENTFTFIPIPDWLVDELKQIKQENIEFWE